MNRTIAIGLAVGACATSASAAGQAYINARIVAETSSPRTGESILIGLVMVPRPGWHGYWSNPGESGLAPTVRWTAPAGVRFGPLQHPAPTLLRVMGMTSYVHAGPHVLLARMAVDRKVPAGAILPVTANLSWAACSDRLCVPEKARLSLRLKVGNGAPSPQARLLRRALASQPKQLGPGFYTARKGRVTLQLPASARLHAAKVRFFPDENGYWNPLDAHVLSASPLRISSPSKGKLPTRISGVVTDGSTAYRLTFKRGAGIR